MARAGVQPLVAELVLGHAQRGVQGIYDATSISRRRREHSSVLAVLIENIVRPEMAVIPMRPRGLNR